MLRILQYCNSPRPPRLKPRDPPASRCEALWAGAGRAVLQFPTSAVLHYFNTLSRQMRIGITFLIIFFSLATFVYASPFRGPWYPGGHKETSREKADHGFNPLRFMVEWYRASISPIDGRNCPMYPTCSQYSLLGLKKHGLLMGWIMTCDRLLRCGRDELSLSPEIIVNGEFRCYDPLEYNDFWWYNAP